MAPPLGYYSWLRKVINTKCKFWTQSDTWWSNLATFETFSSLYSDDEWTLSLDPDDDEQQQIMQNHPTTGKKTIKHTVIQGFLAIRGFVFRGFGIRGFLKP